MWTICNLGSLVALLCASPAVPLGRAQTVQGAATVVFASESGAWELEVAASRVPRPDGSAAAARPPGGSARYALRQGARTAWTAELPFTLRKVLVTEGGRALGYGIVGARSHSELVVATIDAELGLLADVRVPQRPTSQVHRFAGEPGPTGLFLDVVHGRFFVRTWTASPGNERELWLVHDLETGARLDAWDLGRERTCAARSLEDRDLYVACSFAPGGGLGVQLVDSRDGRLVARRTYAPESPARFRETDLEVHENGLFHVWLPRSQQVVRLQALAHRSPRFDGDGGDAGDVELGWSLVERPLASDATTGPRPRPVEPGDEPDRSRTLQGRSIELELLDDVVIDAGRSDTTPPVTAFAFDAARRASVVRRAWETAEEVGYVLAGHSPDGEIEGRVDVAVPRPRKIPGTFELIQLPEIRWWHWKQHATSGWIVTVSPGASPGDDSSAWWVDPQSASLQHLDGWPWLPALRAVVATGAGEVAGVVTLGARVVDDGLRREVRDVVESRSMDGTLRWMLVEPGGTLADLCAFPDESVALLDRANHSLVVLDARGQERQRIALDRGRVQEPARVAADRGGGFVVFDDGPIPALVSFDADGVERARLHPRRADGHPALLRPASLRLDADGRIWVTDDFALHRLGPDGVVDRTIGASPALGVVHETATVLVDPLGRVVLRDAVTRALCVFDDRGRELFVGVGLPAARPTVNARANLAMASAPDGRLFARSPALGGGWLVFEPDGTLAGPWNPSPATNGDSASTFESASDHSTLSFPRRAGRYWVAWSHEARLYQERGARVDPLEIGRVTRRADGRWFEGLVGPALGPRDEVALLDVRDGADPDRARTAISFHNAQGAPERLLELPEGVRACQVVRAGAWLALAWTSGPIWLVRADAVAPEAALRFAPPEMAHTSLVLGASPDGRELWIVTPREPRLRRYALPE